MQPSGEEPYDCHSADMRIPLKTFLLQVEKQTFLISIIQARMKLITFLIGLTFFVSMRWLLSFIKCKQKLFKFADNLSNRVHDNRIVLYEYFEKCFIVLVGLSVGDVHSPQVYDIQLSVE